MKPRLQLFGSKATWLSLATLVAVVNIMAAPPVVTPDTTVPATPRSVFKIPANSKEGRDPFFPASLRPYQAAEVPGHQVVATDFSGLTLQGLMGVSPHQLAVINNVPFGVGDDAEVRTSSGRIQLHCVSISGNSVVINANGQETTLHYGDKP